MSHRQGFGAANVSRALRRKSMLTTASVLALLAAGMSGAAARPLGVSTTFSAPNIAAEAAIVAAQQAAAIARLSQGTMLRASQAVQALQALQNAARNAAAAGPNNLGADPNHPGALLPNVPDGLNAGGLVPDSGLARSGVANPVSSWISANTPVQTTSNGQTTVSIQQTASQALLNWTTFNVGKNTIVQFQQGGTDWVALNRITDPSGVPSQILGQIRAPGSVYLINQNGIIFGGTSQINVGTLIASSLWMNQQLFNNGQLNNPNGEFLFVASGMPFANPNASPADTNTDVAPTNGFNGDVTVQPGATIVATPGAAGTGGRISLIGPNVTNGGSISASEGQVILAAGLQVAFTAHDSSDPSLRGLDTFVGAVGAGGTATNSGLIEIPRGDVAIVGKTILQNGGIDSSTSVALNGRVDLLALYDTTIAQLPNSQGPAAIAYAPSATGTITLGAESIIRVLPETSDSTDTIAATSLALPSQVNLQGNVIHLATAATILAPNANVTVQAGEFTETNGLPQPGGFPFRAISGQILIDDGATIDVSGSQDVAASVADNFIQVQLRGAQLEDSPLQRNGALRGQTVTVDIRETGTNPDGTTWVGTPLADVSGYVGLIQHDVGQLTVNGGKVTMTAGDSVILQPGSTINVSGGWINYQGAVVGTSRLIGADGHLYNISNASPDQVYVGVLNGFTVDHSRWNVTETFASILGGAHYEPGYIQGGNGGTLNIQAPTIALDGSSLVGQTVTGPRQISAPPTAGLLSLAFFGYDPNDVVETVSSSPNIVFGAGASSSNNTLFLPTNLLGSNGFGSLSINDGDGNISVPAGTTLLGAVGGSLTLTGKNVTVDGSVVMPGGTISITTFDYSPNGQGVNAVSGGQPVDPTRGNFVLGPDGILSTAGPITSLATAALNGGSVQVQSVTINLQAGSTIDVSGGIAETSPAKFAVGSGGSISLLAGTDANGAIQGGSLSLGGGVGGLDVNLRGYGGKTGGSLTLRSTFVQIGGSATDPSTLVLAADFFNRGGFSSFTVDGIGATSGTGFATALRIVAGTQIAPVVTNIFGGLDGLGNIIAAPVINPIGQRAPVNLSFNALGVPQVNSVPLVRGDLVMEAGASIVTDPGGHVGINSQGVQGSPQTADIAGMIVAPGGSISISGSGTSNTGASGSDVTSVSVTIEPGAVISTRGVAVTGPNPNGVVVTSAVLAGGTVSLSGNIRVLAGSTIDVSGTTGVLNGPAAPSLTRHIIAGEDVDSDGGTISINVGERLFIDQGANLLGVAGGPTAAGGALLFTATYVPGGPGTPSNITPLIVSQTSAPTAPSAFLSGFGAYVGIDHFEAGGFGSLGLNGLVNFTGPVSISASTSIAIGGAAPTFSADNSVTLTAPYIALGGSFLAPGTPAAIPQGIVPTYGAGSLNVVATGLIDIGNLSLQNIGKVSLTAPDVRGDGTLDVQGTITMTAGQVYPPTATKFVIAAFDYTDGAGVKQSGTVTFNPLPAAGVRPLPLSAGGELDVYASVINQGGVLRAPFGIINLGFDPSAAAPTDALSGLSFQGARSVTLKSGSTTSVSGIDPTTGMAIIVPYGIEQNGNSWIDPLGNNITSGGLPAKSINIFANAIDDQAGSTVDLRGGGDLYAYRFVPGLGGSKDILGSTATSFAILPGYAFNYAPYGAFNAAVGDPGYVSGKLAVGDQIYLNGGNGIPAGYYTLLPARYALLPGAFLVTPQSTKVIAPGPSVAKPDGSSLVAGYRFNDPAGSGSSGRAWSEFEVASGVVVRQRAEYDDFFANATLTQGALAASNAVPRLPQDAGHLLFAATNSVSITGTVLSQTPGGLGGEIDIASTSDIVITATGANPGSYPSSDVILSAQEITALGLDSLLIGGIRSNGPNGTNVRVATNNVTLDNAGSPLAAADVTLVANNNLTLAAGADLEQQGTLSHSADVLVFGSAATSGSGNGVLVRVSSDPNARILRAGVDTTTSPSLAIGAGATLAGTSVIVDSTATTSLSSSVKFGTSHRTVQALSIDSGRISLQLDSTATNPGAGLILTSATLNALQASLQSLSLLSYSSIDIYGGGTVGGPTAQSLAFHAGEIRGFGNTGSTAIFAAQNILLDNVNGSTGPSPAGDSTNSIVFNASVLTIGSGHLAIDQFAGDANNVGVTLSASNGLLGQGTGTLIVQHDLTVRAPVVTGATGANLTFTVGGALNFETSATTGAIAGGLGASFSATAATVSVNTDIRLASGTLTLHATSGDVVVGDINSQATLDVSGTAQAFNDVTQYSSGGSISLVSDTGSVRLNGGNLFLDAQHVASGTPTVGDAGTLSISAVQGRFVFGPAVHLSAQGGTMAASGTTLGNGGSFSLDVVSLSDTAPLNDLLNAASFAYSRSIRVRTGDVTLDGTAQAHSFTLSADQGAITVTGTVDASGATGGSIFLAASKDVTLASGSFLNVHAAIFDNADKGGSVDLETLGNGVNGIDIQAGSKIELTVDAGIGGVGGTLHLRVPRTGVSDSNPGGTDVMILKPIAGTIINASSILIEGYKVYTPADGSIDSVEAQAKADAESFLGAAGTDTHYSAILNRLLAGNGGLASVTTIAPGVEIQNPNGDLTLGSLTSTTASDWDLSSWRFGPDSIAGVLTLRASGNIVLYNSIGDGFYNPTSGPFSVTPDLEAQWGQALFSLMAGPSWSYRIVAGADMAAADYQQVLSLSALGDNSGSVLLGKYSNTPYVAQPNSFGDITSAPFFGGVSYYQVIRTGTGDIDVIAGRDVLLRNPFASIYTAGEAAPAIPNFDTPLTDYSWFPENPTARPPLGGTFQTLTPFPYPALYSFGGGNVTVKAGNDIAHVTLQPGSSDTWQEDSSQELPVNWLFRQGYVDPLTGQFGTIFNIDAYFDDVSLGTTPSTRGKPPNPNAPYAEIASTSWWVDFSNFSEGVGALGGGNVKLIAGRDVSNVDAVVPTNARMPTGTPSAASLVELGGGDLLVQAGRDINGGVYYVERGQGALKAGGSIYTNSTRSTVNPGLANASDPTTWLGTTLFLGNGSFTVSAGGDVLLGGVANPFLLPQGWANSYWLETYFSTYGANDSVNVSSLAGNVTIKDQNPNVGAGGTSGTLFDWINNKMAASSTLTNGALPLKYPWTAVLGIVQTPFQTGLMPGALRVTAFSGDINVTGNLTLAPSSAGTIELLAAGSINGDQSTIDLSDVDPSRIPGITTPFGMSAWPASTNLPVAYTVGNTVTPFFKIANQSNSSGLVPPLAPLFDESGSTSLTLNQKQLLHAPVPLHLNDPEPIHLYAGGNLSGIELFSAKSAEIVAGGDITDVAFYIQDLNSNDLTRVVAGRDIVAFDPNSPLRSAEGCSVAISMCVAPNAGDIQLAGPGTLEVLAGRNLDLGIGASNADGTAAGIVTIGNFANPFIPNIGADVIVAAGLGKLTSLDSSSLDFAAFDARFLNPATAGDLAARYLPELGQLMNAGNLDNNGVWSAYQQLSSDQQHRLALSVFYDVLRDSGRDHNDLNAVNGTRNYEIGFQAISALLPSSAWQGDISLTSREIKTLSGGDISILAPGGALNVGFDLGQNQPIDQGILTEDGGNINIFARDSVNVGTSRIFTLNGGNEIIWSSTGNIAAGAASKTLRVAVPVRVQVDPTTMNVETDLAGLATGGGIGVLQVKPSAPIGDVDLIAPAGFVDAGDAGIRVSGNLNIAAVLVLNASNIQVGGTSTGVPTVQAPPVAALASASNTAGASQKPTTPDQPANSDRPSIIIVEFLGFGGGSGEPQDQDDEGRRKKRDSQQGMRQDSNSAVQVLGAGSLSEHAQQYLTAEEKAKLNNQ
jgi:filamentous hemagglutinin